MHAYVHVNLLYFNEFEILYKLNILSLIIKNRWFIDRFRNRWYSKVNAHKYRERRREGGDKRREKNYAQRVYNIIRN